MKIRKPYVAGTFYEGDRNSLLKRLEWCFKHELGPGKLPEVNENGERKIVTLVSPHAGYMYSGPVAANGFYQLAQDGKPELFIVIGPNHRGLGASISVMVEGAWETPLGTVKINEEIARKIVEKCKYAEEDDSGHMFEHSLEVQIPFLQYVYGSFEFVPICINLQTLSVSKDLGQAIASALQGVDGVIIASTDFTHYEPQESASKKDSKAIEAITKLDEEALFETVSKYRVSMCGYGVVASAIVASKLLGAKEGVLIKYATSGDITRDYSQVVGYAAIKLIR